MTRSRWRSARAVPAGLVQYTDRGSHSTAAAYRPALAARDVIVSLNRAGACLDNALAERCFATLQAELLDAQSWPTRAVTRSAIFAWLVVWYNRQRRHSARGYRAPVAYEERTVVVVAGSDRLAVLCPRQRLFRSFRAPQ